MVIKTAEEIARDYNNLVVKIAYQLKTRNSHLDITDLLSAGNEGLARAAIKAANEDRPEAKLRNYCFSAIHNAMLTIVYSQRHKPRLLSLEQVEDIQEADQGLTGEDTEILKQGIKELPEKYREAIQLSYDFDGQTRPLTDNESAKVRGIPYKTQVTHKRRGINLLKSNPRLIKHFAQ